MRQDSAVRIRHLEHIDLKLLLDFHGKWFPKTPYSGQQ
jgi:hypothetical protein